MHVPTLDQPHSFQLPSESDDCNHHKDEQGSMDEGNDSLTSLVRYNT